MFNFDKKIKRALGKSKVNNSFKSMIGSNNSFKSMIGSNNSFKSMIGSNNSFKSMIGSNNSFKKMMGDYDRDGVKNIMDCKPWDKKKHGGELYWKEMKRKGIRFQDNDTDDYTISRKDKKRVRKVFEKRPELISKAKGIIFCGTHPSQNSPQYCHPNVDEYNVENPGGIFVGKDFSDSNPQTAIVHELKHKEQFENNPEQMNRIGKLNRQAIKEKKLHSKYILEEGYDYKIGGVPTDAQSKAGDKLYDEYLDWYEKLPLEKEAYDEMKKVPERKHHVSQEQVEQAYRDFEDD